MEVEHSRLLKFFKEGRFRSDMAEAPVIKIEKVFESTPNVEAEVPGTQELRELDENYKKNSEVNDSVYTSEVQITGPEFTLSPVITVTKKESTLTKGDMKLQKITVTEDIAMDESENGGYRISRESHESYTRTHSQTSSTVRQESSEEITSGSQTSTSTVVTSRRTEKRVLEGDREGEKSQDEKKSKIPIMRLRQAVEEVKKERKDQKVREKPRRSSIPTLKDAKKATKRSASLKTEPKIEDEFEKIYEEIIDNQQKDIDDRILSIQVDDTQKVDSKFEELVQSYDEDQHERETVSRVSKIPALRRRDNDRANKIGALVDRVKDKSTTTEAQLKDGGFKVTSSTIRTKRFSRGNSRDLSREEQMVNVTETINIKESGDNKVFTKESIRITPVKPERSTHNINKTVKSIHKDETIKSTEYDGSEKVVKETIIKESVTEGTPAKITKITRVTSRETRSHDGQNDDVNEKIDDAKNYSNDGSVTVEEFEDDDGGKRIITTKTTYTQSLLGKPGQPGVTETVTIEELDDEGSLTTTTRTHEGSPEQLSTRVIHETTTRDLSREISSEDFNPKINKNNNVNNEGIITIEEIETGSSKKISKETTSRESVKTGIPVKTERFTRNISREMGNIKRIESKETVKSIDINSSKEINKYTKVNSKETVPVKTERINYGLNRQVSKDNQNVTSQNIATTKEIKKGLNQQVSRETLAKETTNQRTSTQIGDNSNKETVKPEGLEKKKDIRKETMVTEQIEKEGIRIGIPTFTKVTESFSKGRIQTVEMSRTIEWKPADEVKTKNSEKATIELKDTGNIKFEAPVIVSKIAQAANITVNKTQDQIPNDPVLEKQIKDTVKDIANKVTIKNVTEYQTREQVTNVEKSTYSLSKTVDLTVDRDSKEITDVSKSGDNLRVDKEFVFKQISKDYSTNTSVTTDTVNEKKATQHNNLSVQEKDSDTEEVTILKGNVSRLKNKIAQENVVVSKKETDEDLPKKTSILSKIAVFERLEPKEAYPVIMRPTGKKCKYVPHYNNNEQKPIIVDELLKEQPKLDSFGETNNVQISSNYDEVTYVNEPVIIEALWKSEEGYEQNVSAVNRVITEKAVTLETQQTVNEAKNWETDFSQHYRQAETVRTLPAYIQEQDNEKQFEVASTLPGKIDFDPSQTTADKILERDNQNKMQTDNDRSEYEAKISKTKPGKINLNIWKNQVETNKTLVDKIDVIKGENIKEIANTLPGKVHFKSQVPVNKALPENIDLKRDGDQYEDMKILPDKIDFGRHETAPQLIQDQDASTAPYENTIKKQLGNLLTGESSLETRDIVAYEMTAEELKTSPTVDLSVKEDVNNKMSNNVRLDSKQVEQSKLSTDRKDYLTTDRTEINTSKKIVEVSKPTPGKLNLNLWKNQVEVNKTLINKNALKKSKEIEITKTISNVTGAYEKNIESSRTLHGKYEFNNNEKKYETAQMLPARIEIKETRKETNVNTLDPSYSTEDHEVEIVELSPGTPDVNSVTEFETFRTLPARIDFPTEEYQVEEPITLPEKIEFETYEYKESETAVSETSQSNIHFSTTENQTEVVSTLPGKLKSKLDDDKVKIVKPLPGKLDFKAWESKVEENQTLVDKKGIVKSEHQEELAKTLPGKIEFTPHNIKIEDPQILPGRINGNENKVGITTTLQTQTVSEVYQNKAEVATILPEEIEFKTDQGKEDLNAKDNKVKITNESDHKESLSDPELVDEDPDIEPTKFNKPSVIGRIKNKMYFITNLKTVQNSMHNVIKRESSEVSDSKDLYESKVEELQSKTYSIANMGLNTMNQTSTIVTTDNVSTSKNVYAEKTEYFEKYHDNNIINNSAKEYPFNSKTNASQNTITTSIHQTNAAEHRISNAVFETTESRFSSNTNNVQNQMTRSAYGADDFKTNKEEMKRAKSLAELDLGDVINGQVRRIIGRMKSVDYSRRESVKSEKISIKEMPKKMSVLEKIALFEGKASSSKLETTTVPARTTTKPAPKVVTEEEYLRKIEDLTSAKVKFGTMKEMLYIPLPNGTEMPAIALGTALTDKRLLPHVIGAAIDLGYRAIDTAYIYGNEKEIGQAIKAKIDDGTVRREDLFIMSKLWSTFHRRDLVEEACRASLKNLGLDYFDLYMIHNPMSFKEGPDPFPKIATVLQYSEYDYLDAWFGMETLVTKGLVKNIGVSNFNSQQIQRILDKGKLKPVINQVECHPYLTQQRLHAFCAERNISLSCFGVLGSKGTPAEYKSGVPPVIDDPLVQVMAAGLHVTPAQLLIRYQLERGHNVVVKSSTAAHLWDNLQALTFRLNQPEMSGLNALNRNKRMFTFQGMGDTHRNYPFVAGQ